MRGPAGAGARPFTVRRQNIPPERLAGRIGAAGRTGETAVTAFVIDSPPVDGFVPWVVVSATDERQDIFELDAIAETSVIGNYLTSYPESDYAVGIFDTGASASVMGNAAAGTVGLFAADLVTSNLIEIRGVTGSVDAFVSQPFGLFVDGIGSVEPDGLLWDRSGMVGQTNVSIAVGRPNPVDLPVVIGSPLAVYFAAAFYNDRQKTLTRDSEQYDGPDIIFHSIDDPCVVDYPNMIPLELRPLGGSSVQYIPDVLDPFDPDFGSPMSPSVVVGYQSQSVFFVSSVDLYEGSKSAIDKTRFMLDTGAQITVVGSRIAARLMLNHGNRDFEVEIEDVTGEITTADGFYIDLLEIPAVGEWLSFTNVPVVLLDVASPEGGTLDGIIGMNLFVDLNFVLRGGGLFGQDDPSIEFVPLGLAGDIAPDGGDGVVNFLDLAVFCDAWLSVANPPSANWNPLCDITSAVGGPDGKVNFFDFAALAENWQQSLP